jgi:hypothetical protein
MTTTQVIPLDSDLELMRRLRVLVMLNTITEFMVQASEDVPELVVPFQQIREILMIKVSHEFPITNALVEILKGEDVDA